MKIPLFPALGYGLGKIYPALGKVYLMNLQTAVVTVGLSDFALLSLAVLFAPVCTREDSVG